MFSFGVFEKLVGIAVILVAMTVATSTISHGDTALGLMLILGQVQKLFGSHDSHKTIHDAEHIAIHKDI